MGDIFSGKCFPEVITDRTTKHSQDLLTSSGLSLNLQVPRANGNVPEETWHAEIIVLWLNCSSLSASFTTQLACTVQYINTPFFIHEKHLAPYFLDITDQSLLKNIWQVIKIKVVHFSPQGWHFEISQSKTLLSESLLRHFHKSIPEPKLKM